MSLGQWARFFSEKCATTVPATACNDAVQAAIIQANAAENAAYIQGVATFAAGLAALAAGRLAYKAAVASAERQVRLKENQHKALVDAYKIHILQTLTSRSERVKHNINYVSETHFDEETRTRLKDACSLPGDLDRSLWREHSLLGSEFVKAINELRMMSTHASIQLTHSLTIRELELLSRAKERNIITPEAQMRSIKQVFGEVIGAYDKAIVAGSSGPT